MMPEFKYRAKDANGNVVNARIDAATREEAIEGICQQGFYPLAVEPVATGQRSKERSSVHFLDMLNSRKFVTSFTRQMASLMKSGIPILNGLSIIMDQSESAYFSGVLKNIFDEVRDGRKFSEVLVQYPRLFDPFYVSMVKVGEDNGTLPDVLTRLVEYRHKHDEISSKIRGALAYPSLVGAVGLGTVLYIVTQVLPKFLVLIQSARMKMPPITAALLNTISVCREYFPVIVISSGVIYLALTGIYRNPKTRPVVDRMLLGLPIFGKLALESEMVKFTRTLKTSLESGLQILVSLELACSVLSNKAIISELEKCICEVRNGMSLGLRMKMIKIIPPMASSMIAVGEESGRLTEMLAQVADDYEWRVNETVRMIMVLIEPVIILVLGAIVGFIVVALLLPLFQMDNLAR